MEMLIQLLSQCHNILLYRRLIDKGTYLYLIREQVNSTLSLLTFKIINIILNYF